MQPGNPSLSSDSSMRKSTKRSLFCLSVLVLCREKGGKKRTVCCVGEKRMMKDKEIQYVPDKKRNREPFSLSPSLSVISTYSSLSPNVILVEISDCPQRVSKNETLRCRWERAW